MIDLWVTVQDCCGVAGLPAGAPNVRRKLESFVAGNEALTRKRAGSKAVEFNVCAFPAHIRAEVLLRHNQIETSAGVIQLPQKQVDPVRQKLWQNWERAGTTQREQAQERVKAVILMTELVNSGLGVRQSAALAGKQLNISENTLRTWYRRTRNHPRSDWGPALLDTRITTGSACTRKADFDEEAWDWIKTDYLRLEQPSLTACYLRLEKKAKETGWVIPSYDTVSRRIKEIPVEARVLLREGEYALSQLYPAQRRTVANMSAGEWLNGDGYKHNVWVIWHNGEECRPKTWFWQDVYSRKIVGYYTDISENTDAIRYSLLDVIDKYGRPQHITIDNTRAAANKALTAGVPNRYRFKVREDDPIGIIPMLGIDLHWTTVEYGHGNGQAKPIERAFNAGGVGEYVDKHPACAGAWTGPNPTAKPDYQHKKNVRGNKTRPIPVETFLQALDDGIATWNAIVGRETEICGGKLSFDQAFAASYEQRIHQFLPQEQLRMLMLCSEATTVRRDGTFTLKSGGQIQNQENVYKAEALLGAPVKKVVVRFDPRCLHGDVFCYDLDGNFICQAVCDVAAAFGDTQAAREHKRLKTQKIKAAKKVAKAQTQMDILELSELMSKPEVPATVARPVVAFPVAGNMARKPQPVVDESQDNSAFNDYMESVYQQQLMK
ncbi:Mu transposase C-terminal domain-containing protein [Salmonella enterica]|nr:Mu transposase C-terminal domain-containing protein [Salmonella enterica]EKJ0768406.1 Mu transposase C-terminal domain-containing protein [Salmonella enterica]